MGKRSNFERRRSDAYFTPYSAVLPLIPFLTPGKTFIEPCAGDGRLIRHLKRHGLECVYACDIEPKAEDIEKRDILFFGDDLPPCDLIITNPPWERDPLHRMIDAFRLRAPCWLLFDSDWMFTAQARPYLPFCAKIVSIGRVSWMDNGTAGKDNSCWYNFVDHQVETIFYP